ncbi:LysR substrate-binding domain-containing protein [Achromobacter xylosoxidans]|uniref:LysR substrate-binding domain-containing protein n=1 Tax=Alcaligenes xylosoxydans xylosoxydans TaxID=85698 RepID=UPI0006C10093|nr:LysR substrate-binding domain-containing protein [Achromobacter xylosoxidans]CUJ00034.1 LysR family transcriptional regulator [Achromobacter xylosoxidans]
MKFTQDMAQGGHGRLDQEQRRIPADAAPARACWHGSLRDRPVGQAGALRVRLPDASVRHALAPALAAFAERHPDLAMQLDSPGGADAAPQPCDISIGLEPPADPAWMAHRLGALRANLYAAPGYLARRPAPEHPADLAMHDCIGLHVGAHRAHDTRPARWRLWCGPERVVVLARERYGVDTPAMALQLAARGVGIAALHALGAAVWRGAGLVPVLPRWELEPVTLYALTGSRRLPTRAHALIDWLARTLA